MCWCKHASMDTFVGSDTINNTSVVIMKQNIQSIRLEYVSFDSAYVNGGIMMMETAAVISKQ